MLRLTHPTTTFRVPGGIHAIETAELPVIQVVAHGEAGVTVEINAVSFDVEGRAERQRATARLQYAEAVVLSEQIEEIIRDASGLVMHARIAARAAGQRQRALEEFFDPRQLDLPELAA